MPRLVPALAALFVVRLLFNRFFSLSTSHWRFISVSDVVRLAGAVACGSAVVLLAAMLWPERFPVPASVLFLEALFTLCTIAGVWVMYRVGFERLRQHRAPQQPTKRVLIVGAGEAGNLLVREMARYPTGYLPVGFVDDDPAKHGARIHGFKVHGAIGDLARIASSLRVDEVILAIPSAGPSELRRLVAACERTGLGFKVLPGIIEVLAGDVRVGQLREARIEDLLGRDPIQLELPELAADLRGRSVLITGAAGSIGSELARQVALHSPGTMVLLDQAETALFFMELELREQHPELRIIPVVGDIVDAATVERVFEEFAPERVFHAAAYKHVPMMELNPREAIRNNVVGTWRVAEAAGRHGAGKFVLVSTDKAVRPANVMGATKRLAEATVIELQRHFPCTAFGAVRFGNVLGSNGSVIPIFRRRLEEGKPLQVTHPEVTRYFMTIPEAVQLILQASVLEELRGRIAMLDMGEPVRIVDLARNLLHLSGAKGDLDEMITFSGLRPGEKLHEELVAPDEVSTATAIPKVRLLESEFDAARGIAARLPDWDEGFAAGASQEVLEAFYGLFPDIARNGANGEGEGEGWAERDGRHPAVSALNGVAHRM
jgi:FlaA1/EpsC-like NDP-sugar epimerase